MRTDVSALYVDRLGPYPKLVADWWDEKRDARSYVGPNPVVAHPPCGPWGRLKHLSKQPRELAPAAVDQVRRFGGVLEHPAGSGLWSHSRLPLPSELPDEFGGYTLAVNQVEWGHSCLKPTWVYCVGIRRTVPSPPTPGRQPTHGIWYGSFERSGHAGSPLLGASKEIRRRTPVAFAEWLIELAAQAKQTARSA